MLQLAETATKIFMCILYSGLGIFVHYGYLSWPCMYIVVIK